MNPNLTEVSKPTHWKPGVSGNPNGRPVGSRTVFSGGFLKDLAEVWSEEGRETKVKTAKTNPPGAMASVNGSTIFLSYQRGAADLS